MSSGAGSRARPRPGRGAPSAADHRATSWPSGRTSTAPAGARSSAVAVRGSVTTSSTGAVKPVCPATSAQRASSVGANRVRPSPMRSRVEIRSPSRSNQQWDEAVVEVPWERLVGGASGATRRSGSAHVVKPNRTALVLVAAEQLGRRPAPEHPRQLPSQVEGVLDPGVHAGAAAGRHAVGGVADQEAPVPAVALGDLGGEGETAAPLEGDVEVGDSCGGTDHRDEVAFGQIVHAGLFGRPLTGQPPPVLPAPAGKDAAIHVGMLEDVERMTPVPDDMIQRGEELHPLVDGQVIRALHARCRARSAPRCARRRRRWRTSPPPARNVASTSCCRPATSRP